MGRLILLLSMLVTAGAWAAGPIPELRSMRVRFAGETDVMLIRYSSYCTLNSELYKLYGGERNLIAMPAESKSEMLSGLDNQGICTWPNGMYLINGQGYRFFQRNYACKTLPGEVEHQEKLMPGSYRVVSVDAFRERVLTGDCSYDKNITFCRKMNALKHDTFFSCEVFSDHVKVWASNPDTGEISATAISTADVTQGEAQATSVENINDEIYRLEGWRGACDGLSGKNMCVSFLALAAIPDRWAKAGGAVGTFACYWVSGTCVRIIDHMIDDKKYEKEQLRKKIAEREAKAKAEGTVAVSVGGATPAPQGNPTSPDGVILPDPFPPSYNGEAIISEAPPGPMPGTGGSSPGGHGVQHL